MISNTLGKLKKNFYNEFKSYNRYTKQQSSQVEDTIKTNIRTTEVENSFKENESQSNIDLKMIEQKLENLILEERVTEPPKLNNIITNFKILENNEYNNLSILESYIKEYYTNIKESDFTTLVDIVYMSSIRNDINIQDLCLDLYDGILDLDEFRQLNSGNIYDLINKKYVLFAKRIKDINVGSNGGMANIGKGEWLISLCSGINPLTRKPRARIIKGNGDIRFDDNKTEEIKWNGGKVSINKAGNEINKIFRKKVSNVKDWVPFRIKDVNKHSTKEINYYNTKYWESITEEINEELTDSELKNKIINMAFQQVFQKCNSFIMFNDDGQFQRFNNLCDVNLYYKDKLMKLKGKTGFECRANQANPISLYCYVF